MTEMETELPIYQGSTVQSATAPGYQTSQNTVQVPEVQHHGNTRSNTNDDEKVDKKVDETDIILPIDPGDVPQQKYLSVSSYHCLLWQAKPIRTPNPKPPRQL